LRPPVFGRAVGSARAKPGSLDLNFGTRGSVTTAIGSDPHSDDVATGVALQANGKIVVAGYTGVYPRLEIALARYNRAGSLDTSFGGDGQVTTAIGSSSGASGVAILANGKIVVGGDTGVHPSSFAVTRYNGDGSPDTSFGVDGQVTTAIGLGAGASDLVLQPDGKIVLAGSAGEGSTRDFALARYNADGSLDSSFGTDGTITTPIGSGNDIATALARQPNGKLVAAGFSDNGSNWDFALARYNADGSLDTTFDGDGKVTTAIGSNEDRASALALQRDGKLVAAGWSYNGSNYDFALVRYNENGSLDTSFGAGGKVTTALGPNHDLSFALARQPDGKLVAGGFSESPADVPNTFILARYQANGSLDSSFGAAGSVRTAFGRGRRVRQRARDTAGREAGRRRLERQRRERRLRARPLPERQGTMPRAEREAEDGSAGQAPSPPGLLLCRADHASLLEQPQEGPRDLTDTEGRDAQGGLGKGNAENQQGHAQTALMRRFKNARPLGVLSHTPPSGELEGRGERC
jgi:uncharacterized delta-60 repeat protein